MRRVFPEETAIIIISIVMITILIIDDLEARPWRPSQIPNGKEFACANCHKSINGGGPRNPFGVEVRNLIVFPGSNEPFWSPALAPKDSDGDQVTNGEELQDPDGMFQPGNPSPGDPKLVTNPGDPDSVPKEH